MFLISYYSIRLDQFHINQLSLLQIMPQLLNSLKNENIDWGTLAVYTCEQSCDPADCGYAREFVYKQDVVNTEPQAPPPEIGHE